VIDSIVAAVEAVTGRRVVARHDPPGSGYTPAIRFVAALDSGDRVFVKAASDPHIGGWIRQEIDFYRSVDGPFLPGFVGAGEASTDGLPVLVIEDLSAARWPPPWDDASIEAVLAALGRLHGHASAADVPSLEVLHPDLAAGWDTVADDPGVLTDTGLCTASWLADVLPHFRRAARGAPLAGESLCHLDVRSDNVCFMDDGSARLIDWNQACRANAELDLACWVPSLAYESGMDPEELGFDVDPGLAAVVAGFFAARAGLPAIPKAPGVRDVQLAQLAVALPWAARRCGFAAP
jgi:hypothetical protein